MASSDYARVSDLLTREEFDAKVGAMVEAWGGRIDRDAAGRLVLDQLGRGAEDIRNIADAREGMEVTLRVTVVTTGDVRTFARKDGTEGQVCNLDIKDRSGRCRLVLWDEDTQLVARRRIGQGTALRLVDCFVKVSRFGTEVSRGKFGAVIVEA